VLPVSEQNPNCQLELFHNPYCFLQEEEAAGSPSLGFLDEKKQAYLTNLRDPYAYLEFFSANERAQVLPPGEDKAKNRLAPKTHRGKKQPSDSQMTRQDLEDLVDEVLAKHKPNVARGEWSKVMEYKSEFLTLASATPETSARVAEALRSLNLQLLPGEKIEFYRAPAERIIAELKRLLG
jgi:hypothetical protein